MGSSEHLGFYFVRGANLELIPRRFEFSELLHRGPDENTKYPSRPEPRTNNNSNPSRILHAQASLAATGVCGLLS